MTNINKLSYIQVKTETYDTRSQDIYIGHYDDYQLTNNQLTVLNNEQLTRGAERYG